MINLKFLIVGFSLFCMVNSMKGQTEQGNVLLGGETKLSFSSSKSKWKSENGDSDYGKTYNFEFSPQIGLFTTDGLALGIVIPISYLSENDEFNNKYKAVSLGLSYFTRYYIGSGMVKPYLHGEIGAGKQKVKINPSNGRFSISLICF